jgi:divalent metal cation (Fe/Co/Zn/Cd) transporter
MTIIEKRGSDTSRALDARRGRQLEYVSLACSLAEAAVAMIAGVWAGSVVLTGFGVDSIIESLSGAVLLWRLQSHEADHQREALALRLVGWSFLALAAYVAFDAIRALAAQESPEPSLVGIAVSLASLVVMPLLARAKRQVAARLNSRALEADSRQTDLCALLAAIVLVGLALNAAFGWWWADPLAALVMTPIIAREGLAALRGEICHEC